MSVFTSVSTDDLATWLTGHTAGTCLALTPIAEGVENTNYFLDTTQGRFVLTLFERLEPSALPFYLGLMRALADHQVCAPAPLADRQGRLFSPLCGKPAALVSRLAGKPIETPLAEHCAALGHWLAHMHQALTDFTPRLENPRGTEWRTLTAERVRPFLDAEALQLLDRSLQKFNDNATLDLPRAVIHADVFRDNALWADADAAVLAGVIDFYFAGVDDCLLDLAITANDWCLSADGASLDRSRCKALLTAYHAVRPLTDAERHAWPIMLGRAALRFWLSRLADLHLPRPGDLVKVKNPDEYRAILIQRLALTASPHAVPWID